MATSKQPTKKKATEEKDVMIIEGVDFAADAGGGMEEADKDSFAIPFLRVLQKISPQCDEADAQYIKGAKGGMLYNSVTGELYKGDEGVLFLPCAFQRRFIQWAPRGAEGGYRGEHMPEDVAEMRNNGELYEEDGALYTSDAKGADRLVDTRSHFGIVVEEKGNSQVVMPLASTQIKKSKQLMSMLSSAKVKTKKGLVTPPTWMNKIRITTVLESNDQGSWYGVKFTHEGFINDADLYVAGKSFHDTIVAGQARVAYEANSEQDEKF